MWRHPCTTTVLGIVSTELHFFAVIRLHVILYRLLLIDCCVEISYFEIEHLQTAASKDISADLALIHTRLKHFSSVFDTIMSVLMPGKNYLMMMIMITSDQEKI